MSLYCWRSLGYPEIAHKGSGVQGVGRIWMRGRSRSRCTITGAMRARPMPRLISGNIETSVSRYTAVLSIRSGYRRYYHTEEKDTKQFSQGSHGLGWRGLEDIAPPGGQHVMTWPKNIGERSTR